MDMPDDLVTPEQIADRFYRPLTVDEERVLPAWIDDAWHELMDLAYLRLEERLTADPPEEGLLDKVARVIRAAILRRLKNPQGIRQWSRSVDDATVSETLGTETLADGWFTDSELAKLEPAGFASDAFSIRLDKGAAPWPRGPLPAPTDEWYPWISM